MSRSLLKNNRRRRRAAGLLVATAASAALALGSTHSAAEAALVPNVYGISAGCDAGDSEISDESIVVDPSPLPLPSVTVPVTADCTESSPSVIAQVGDTLFELFGVDFGITPSDLNTAGATIGVSEEFPFVTGGTATIKGTGYNTALVILGGKATANAQNYISGAFAVSSLGGVSEANANIFGLSVASAVGSGTATANALPGGIAIAMISGGSGLTEVPTASATALGGITSATWNLTDEAQTVCTALYGTASVKDSDGNNLSSCTSILFIFQASQEGDGPTVYSIKNPFSIDFVSPVSTELAEVIEYLLTAAGADPTAAELLSGQFIPKFDQDLVNVYFDDGTPVFGSDVIPTSTSAAQTLTAAGAQDEVVSELSAVPEAKSFSNVDLAGAEDSGTGVEPGVSNESASETPEQVDLTEEQNTAPAENNDAPEAEAPEAEEPKVEDSKDEGNEPQEEVEKASTAEESATDTTDATDSE